MIRFLFLAQVVTITTILLVLLSQMRPLLATLANLIIVIPPQISIW